MNFKEALIAHLSGEKVEVRGVQTTPPWQPFMEYHRNVQMYLIDVPDFAGACDYRIAPRTVMIGDVECEAALSEVAAGEQYFTWDASINKPSALTFDGGNFDSNIVLSKQAFATKEACEAAHAAWVKLMTQP